MLTTIAALYVILPALAALAAVLYATYCPIAVKDEKEEIMCNIYAQLRDIQARYAIRAMREVAYWRSKGRTDLAAMWESEAITRKLRADAYQEMACAL